MLVNKIKYLVLAVLFANNINGLTCLAQDSGFFSYNWKAAIDSCWGQGLPTEDKLKVFDSVWTTIDKNFACFNNLNINWDSLKNVYSSEIEKGLSEGRFTTILNHLGLHLQEAHTSVSNLFVNYNHSPQLKEPLIYPDSWGLDAHFGAGLSVLPDSSLLVYTAEENHPLGLEPGDVILGYEGVPWKKLYKILLDMEFPVGCQQGIGGNESSITENWLKGAGENWHLFNTIDIVKYNSKDTLHLPTSLLINKTFTIHHSDQLPVPGVKFHKQFQDDKEGQDYTLSWGIVDSTNIGYIYIWSWFENDIPKRFYNALDSLINVYNVEGLILDMRANHGGYVRASDSGLRLLFPQTPSTLGLADRNNPENHFTLSNCERYYLSIQPDIFFNKPIALLTGSFAISAADFICYRLREHPHVRSFGTPTSASFASSERIQLNNYVLVYANSNGYSDSAPNIYLTHQNLPVDVEVHFTPDDVRDSIDTIVKTAITWINNENAVHVDRTSKMENVYSLLNNYPNPFNPVTNIEFEIPKTSLISLEIYDVLGRKVFTLLNEEKAAGRYNIQFNAANLSSGFYFYTLRTKDFVQTKKMILLK